MVTIIMSPYRGAVSSYAVAINTLCLALKSSHISTQKLILHKENEVPIYSNVKLRKRIIYSLRLLKHLIFKNNKNDRLILYSADYEILFSVLLANVVKRFQIIFFPDCLHLLQHKYRSPLKQFILKRTLKQAQHTLTISKSANRQLFRFLNNPKKNTCVDINAWFTNIPKVAEKNDALPKKFRGRFPVAIGGISSPAALEVVKQVCVAIQKEDTEILLTLDGDCRYRYELENWGKKRRISNFIFETSQNLDELYAVINATKLLVHLDIDPNTYQFPDKMMAFSSAEKPIIYVNQKSSDLTKLIREHQCGSIVSKKFQENIKDSIISYYHNRGLLDALGQNAAKLFPSATSCVELYWKPIIKTLV